jgi:hypothetical protein
VHRGLGRRSVVAANLSLGCRIYRPSPHALHYYRNVGACVGRAGVHGAWATWACVGQPCHLWGFCACADGMCGLCAGRLSFGRLSCFRFCVPACACLVCPSFSIFQSSHGHTVRWPGSLNPWTHMHWHSILLACWHDGERHHHHHHHRDGVGVGLRLSGRLLGGPRPHVPTERAKKAAAPQSRPPSCRCRRYASARGSSRSSRTTGTLPVLKREARPADHRPGWTAASLQSLLPTAPVSARSVGAGLLPPCTHPIADQLLQPLVPPAAPALIAPTSTAPFLRAGTRL